MTAFSNVKWLNQRIVTSYISTKTTPLQDDSKDIIFSEIYDPRPNDFHYKVQVFESCNNLVFPMIKYFTKTMKQEKYPQLSSILCKGRGTLMKKLFKKSISLLKIEKHLLIFSRNGLVNVVTSAFAANMVKTASSTYNYLALYQPLTSPIHEEVKPYQSTSRVLCVIITFYLLLPEFLHSYKLSI